MRCTSVGSGRSPVETRGGVVASSYGSRSCMESLAMGSRPVLGWPERTPQSRSHLVEQPRRASGAGPGLLDAVTQLSVGGHHDHSATVPDGNLPPHLVDDGIVSGPFSVNGAQACLAIGRGAAARLPLEDQHDLVLGQVGGRQLVVQSVGGAGAVTPPAVGSAAHHIGTV